MMSLAFQVGPVQFNQPVWLVLLPITWVLTIWIGRRTLSGMGTTLRRVSLVVRLIVIALLVAAVAEPHFRREAKAVAVTVLLDASRSEQGSGGNMQKRAEEYIVAAGKGAREGDQIGVVTAARDAYVQALPGPVGRPLDVQFVGATDATNLEQAVRLGMAVMGQEAAHRLLIISDGNETAGSLLSAAKAAKAAGVPIDVLPSRFKLDREVIFDRLLVPATARQNENITLRAVITATRPTTGRLTLTLGGEPIDLNGDEPGVAKAVTLDAGTNVFPVPITVPSSGPQRFEAVFEPDGTQTTASGDTLAENNRALGVTFVGGDGRVLVLVSSDRPDEADGLVAVLKAARLTVEKRSAASGFTGLDDLSRYEGVVMANTSAYDFNQQQQEELRAYVHDLGGGLLVIGGPESFGAGGWIGSPLADALPIKLDPPQKRQMPRGALALIMHSCEIPNGNYWGRRTGEAAVDALSARDYIGALESDWTAGSAAWVLPMSEKGDGAAAKRAFRSMRFGDTQSFVQMMEMALAALQKIPAGQKHVIIISDGDPAAPPDALIQQYIASRISVSTVGVGMHRNPADLAKMRRMAQLLGGNFHEIDPGGKMDSLPQIFIKEAQTVKRSLIWEGEPFSPKIVGGLVDTLRGVNAVPPITGYVVAAERAGLAQVVLRGTEDDPVMAQWQYGLGRVVAFTSDLGGRWAQPWPAWAQYKPFWEQVTRWAMRPAGSPNIRVTTEDLGEQTRVVVEALDDQGDRLNFLRWDARAVRPDLSAETLNLRQVGPGRYETLVDTSLAGTFTLSMGWTQFDSGTEGNVSAAPKRGNVQAAVTRPFADEFRALRDNAPLLEQVAKETNGRVLTGDPAKDELWSRANVRVPVSLQAMWLGVALAAIALFLADVAVRRVRIDVVAMAKAVRRGFGRGAAATGQPIENLKAARDKAKKRMEEAARERGSASPAARALASEADKRVKFEATPDELKAARGAKAVTDFKPIAAPVVDKSKATTQGEGEEQGMSRLMKAKRRAKDEIEDQ